MWKFYVKKYMDNFKFEIQHLWEKRRWQWVAHGYLVCKGSPVADFCIVQANFVISTQALSSSQEQLPEHINQNDDVYDSQNQKHLLDSNRIQ